MTHQKRYLCIVGLLLCLSLASCGDADRIPADGTVSDSEGIVAVTAGIEPDFDYVYGTDDQPDRSKMIIYTKDGKYIMQTLQNGESAVRGYMLQFYDYATKQTVYVCGKPNCDHTNTECNAFFEERQYFLGEIYFYENNLYIMKNEDGYYYMEQIAPDGSRRERKCTLYRMVEESYVDENGALYTLKEYPRVILHRGYAYYSTYYPGNKECELYRIKLEGDGEAELLYRQGGEGITPMLYRLKAYGRYVFFQSGNCTDDAGEVLDISLYAWDTVENQVITVKKDVLRDYTLDQNALYYFDLDLTSQGNVMRYDLITGECRTLIESSGQEEPSPGEIWIFIRDKKLYYAYTDSQKVYDEEGNLLTVLKGDDMIAPY